MNRSRARKCGLVTCTILAAALLVPGGSALARADCPSGDQGGEWPIYGHDLANTRHQDEEKKISSDNVASLSPTWTFAASSAGGDGTFESTPIVAEGCLFIATNSGWIFSLDADTGKVVWKKKAPATVTTLAVSDGRVFANVSRVDRPFVVALDQATGRQLWKTVVDRQKGSDLTGSPTAYGEMVMTGVSCIGAEGSSGEERLGCRGNVTILGSKRGRVLGKAYGIPDRDFKKGFAGGGIWSTPAIDTQTRYGYVGAGNPFSFKEHSRTNAILKFDVDPARKTFGQVVDSYKGNEDQYVPVLGADKPVCEATGHQGATCEALDLDFGMSPNLFTSSGHKMVGNGQGSGIFHAVRADTMEYVWTSVVGPPLFGARGGGSAYDGKALYGPGGSPGQVYALDKDTGNPRWFGLTADAVHSWHPVASANGVIYTMDARGFLNAFDAKEGTPLLVRPMQIDAGGSTTSLGAGVIVARNTVYATGGEFIVAYGL